MPPSEASPVRTDFGSINGETVELVRLQVDGLTAELITVGAAVHRVVAQLRRRPTRRLTSSRRPSPASVETDIGPRDHGL